MTKNNKRYAVCSSLLLGILAVGLLATPAFANTLFKGTFTLTHETHWGNALLPPGEYLLALDESAHTLLISDARTNKPIALQIVRVDASAQNADSRLLIAGPRDQRVVYSARLAGFGEVFRSAPAYQMARKAPKGTGIEEAVVIERSRAAGK
jgi:hypothetical protein